jgi:hypothetical protein
MDGGYSLQIWKITDNIWNKQSQSADRGVPPYLRVGRGAKISSP